MGDDGEVSVTSQHRVMVPKFLVKTFDLVENPETDEYVGWNEDGTVVVVKKLHEFAEKVLPQYFKHSNYASFVRQLNMYGFSRADLESQAFKHPMFLRGKRENLALIKRKISLPKQDQKDLADKRKQELDRVMSEVRTLRDRQARFDDEITRLKGKNAHLDQENHMLWAAMEQARERQKNISQKLRFVLMFLYKNYIHPKGTGTLEDGFSPQDIPKLMDAAQSIGISVSEPDIDDPDDLPTRSSTNALTYSTPKVPALPASSAVESNDLERFPSLLSLPSLSVPESNLSTHANPLKPDQIDDKNVFATPTIPSNGNAAGLEKADSLNLTPSLFGNIDGGHDDVNNLVHSLSEFFNDQDDTMRRLESISSTFSDPGDLDSNLKFSESDHSLLGTPVSGLKRKLSDSKAKKETSPKKNKK